MQIEGTRMYRVKEVAEHFNVSVNTVYRAIESGALGALKLGGRQGTVRVPGHAVLAYAETCEQATYQASGAGRATYEADTGTPVPAGGVGGGLSAAQADGLACVVCGVDFLTVSVSRVPVGRSVTGSQVFACVGHHGVCDVVCGQGCESSVGEVSR